MSEHYPKGFLFLYTNGRVCVADGQGGQVPVNIPELIAERDALRAEIERLKNVVLDYQNRCNPYVSLATQRDADQLRAEVERLREAQRWISVQEQLPPVNTAVLTRWRGETFSVDWMFPSGEWTTGAFVTHWMPLPEPPKEVQG